MSPAQALWEMEQRIVRETAERDRLDIAVRAMREQATRLRLSLTEEQARLYDTLRTLFGGAAIAAHPRDETNPREQRTSGPRVAALVRR